jgi:hypothetical protein
MVKPQYKVVFSIMTAGKSQNIQAARHNGCQLKIEDLPSLQTWVML